jgi:hypothetical protein
VKPIDVLRCIRALSPDKDGQEDEKKTSKAVSGSDTAHASADDLHEGDTDSATCFDHDKCGEPDDFLHKLYMYAPFKPLDFWCILQNEVFENPITKIRGSSN